MDCSKAEAAAPHPVYPPVFLIRAWTRHVIR